MKFKEFTAGSVQENVKIQTTKGTFVLKRYKARSRDFALVELNLLSRLAKTSLPIAKPIKNKNGELITEYNGRLCTIIKFLEGKHAKNPNTYKPIGQAKEVVKALAALHKNTQGHKPKNYKLRDSYDQQCCKRTARYFVKKLRSEEKKKERTKWLNETLKTIKIPASLPKGMCHCDTHCSNFLFKGNKLTGMIDFDDAGYTWLMYDIANLLYFWAWPPKKDINLKKAKALVDEYQGYRKLNTSEQKYLFDVLKMVILMSASWFIHVDNDFKQEQGRIEVLDQIGREAFQKALFN